MFVCGEYINVQDCYDGTLLHEACRNNDSDIVGALLLAGADQTIPNDDYNTPEQVAKYYKYERVLSLLDVSSG